MNLIDPRLAPVEFEMGREQHRIGKTQNKPFQLYQQAENVQVDFLGGAEIEED